MKDDTESTPEADKGVEVEVEAERLWRKKGVSDPSEVVTLFLPQNSLIINDDDHPYSPTAFYPYPVPIPNPIAISEHIMHLSIFPYRIHETDAQTAVIFRSLPYLSSVERILFAESGVSESRG